ncbi:MarR family winged helix-turn-helix transcriptional regulator [Rubrivirga marina]|uniref:MarR family transcriptional regulator n=1 Tax=Rubrivirga marina TaxID=1196024 RepID=A0A271IZ41_9BACT|nr:MarR family transcriptional regulator [Rubrivirga marina]PAP76084.1 MarR family transcriptional regulator [Rubrivirga marina]
MTLSDLIQQDHFASLEQEALLNVLATASWISGEMTAAMAPHGVTQAQYNVLRILRGRHPERYACSEIGERLLDRTPDVTRLLVRLEARGLIKRERAEHDRRVVEVHITPEGLDVLSRLDAPVAEAIGRLGRHLTDDQLSQLSSLLETLRTDQEA